MRHIEVAGAVERHLRAHIMPFAVGVVRRKVARHAAAQFGYWPAVIGLRAVENFLAAALRGRQRGPKRAEPVGRTRASP